MSLVMITGISEDQAQKSPLRFKFEFHLQNVGYFQGEDHGNVERTSHPIFVGGFEGKSSKNSGSVIMDWLS